jgi:hypothetical protein
MRRVSGLLVVLSGLLTLVSAARAQEPVKIVVTGTPSFPAQNLLKNADFTLHTGTQITDWTFNTATPTNFDIGWSEVGRTAPGSAWINTHTGSMSGYWYQYVPVKPGKPVMVWCWLRTGGGHNLLYLTGDVQPPQGQRYLFDERAMQSSIKSSPLAPIWIKREYLRGPPLDAWTLLQKVIDIPQGMTTLCVHIGSYFMRGELWADDMYAGPPQFDLSATVQVAAGLRQVRVLDNKGQVVFDSGALPAGSNHWAKTLLQLDGRQFYVIEATGVDGKVTKSERFPPLAL